MMIETPQPLPETLEMQCYCCEIQQATHLCRYMVGDLAVQVCLCPGCMKIDTRRLLENTVGIQGIAGHAAPDDRETAERCSQGVIATSSRQVPA